ASRRGPHRLRAEAQDALGRADAPVDEEAHEGPEEGLSASHATSAGRAREPSPQAVHRVGRERVELDDRREVDRLAAARRVIGSGPDGEATRDEATAQHPVEPAERLDAIDAG